MRQRPPTFRLPRLEAIHGAPIRGMLEHRWLPVVLALVITGLGAASAALLFRTGLDGLGRWRLRLLEVVPAPLLLPVLGAGGGLTAGLLVEHLAPAAQGSGIPQVMQFLRNRPVPMGIQVAVVKLVAGIVAIGCGFPLGPSGPSVQMGSSVGWEMARLLRAPGPFTRLIVAAGGGAGIAAVFRAPIGGFLYALEELLQGARPVVMLLVLVTTFWADTWADLMGLAGLHPGASPTGWAPGAGLQLQRQVIAYVEVVPLDLVLLFFLGMLVAIPAEAYCRYVLRLQVLFRELRLPLWMAMAGAGALIGGIDALLPADFINRAAIRQAVAEGDVDLPRALAIFLVVSLTTGLSAAAGTPGGLFAPMLTLGGALGLCLAGLIDQAGLDAPGTVVFAGMGAFMAACARTPMSATFLTFAVTKELLILKPVLAACVGSLIIARLLHPQSLFQRLIPPAAAASRVGGGAGRPVELSMGTVPLRPRLPRNEAAGAGTPEEGLAGSPRSDGSPQGERPQPPPA